MTNDAIIKRMHELASVVTGMKLDVIDDLRLHGTSLRRHENAVLIELVELARQLKLDIVDVGARPQPPPPPPAPPKSFWTLWGL